MWHRCGLFNTRPERPGHAYGGARLACGCLRAKTEILLAKLELPGPSCATICRLSEPKSIVFKGELRLVNQLQEGKSAASVCVRFLPMADERKGMMRKGEPMSPLLTWHLRRCSALAVLLVCLFGVAGLARADAIYVYLGNSFTDFHGTDTCPPECSISGYVIFNNPLPPDLDGTNSQYQFDVTPLSYAFTDGSIVATSSNSSYDFFSLSTNASGGITSWAIRLFNPPNDGGNYTGIQLLTSTAIDISTEAPAAVNFAALPGDPGQWYEVAVPEPSTLAMLIGGLLSLAGMGLFVRRRKFGILTRS